MRCPFFRETRVKYCTVCPIKPIPYDPQLASEEICSQAAYRNCRLARNQGEVDQPVEGCRFLHERKAGSCSVAPVTKFIPCQPQLFSRCTGYGHRFCHLYLALARPPLTEAVGSRDRPGEEMLFPDHLWYSRNHMWLDAGDGTVGHLGVDAFFTAVLGFADELLFETREGPGRPRVGFRISGKKLDLVFPNALRIVEVNVHLASGPSDLFADPYGRGWLFAGLAAPPEGPNGVGGLSRGLLTGEAVAGWAQQEIERLSRFVHQSVKPAGSKVGAVLQNGGQARGGLAQRLEPRTLKRLFIEFFSLPKSARCRTS